MVSRNDLLEFIYDPMAIQWSDHMRAFNPFRVLGLETKETRQVRVLAWLLDPSGSHGLGDGYLRLFLQVASSGLTERSVLLAHAMSPGSPPRIRREVATTELENLQFEDLNTSLDPPREEQPGRLDLLLQTPSWVVAVEAKVRAVAGDDQLPNYWTALRNCRTPLLCIYLTSNEADTPKDKRWVHLTWRSAVAEPLRLLLSVPNLARATGAVTDFLRSFLEVVEEHSKVPEVRANWLLSQLAVKHGPVLSRIKRELEDDAVPLVTLHADMVRAVLKEYDPPAAARARDIAEMIRSRIDAQGLPAYELSRSDNSYIRFFPRQWCSVEWLFEPRTGTVPGLICEAQNDYATNGQQEHSRMRFKLMLYDLNPTVDTDIYVECRRRLLDLIRQVPANREVFSNAFNRATNRYFGILFTEWVNTVDGLSASLAATLAPAMAQLTPLIAEVEEWRMRGA